MKFIPGWTAAEWIKHLTDGQCIECGSHGGDRYTTLWFSGDTNPVRPGWYERISTLGTWRSHWNGSMWELWEGLRQDSAPFGGYPAWRGITEAAFKRGAA